MHHHHHHYKQMTMDTNQAWEQSSPIRSSTTHHKHGHPSSSVDVITKAIPLMDITTVNHHAHHHGHHSRPSSWASIRSPIIMASSPRTSSWSPSCPYPTHPDIIMVPSSSKHHSRTSLNGIHHHHDHDS
ncbi:hypothetical protein AVEN_137552-1 [Araneus ventricosus]|uniref:Uncharacterized protein n=1 Tax=Araneus ventricosus TaxID=182803 RepID=A0A4Y2FND5_ARAVE|nr:hypothetical protein AVEN_137552-1 [Araneus ventricosus]